ncbi:MAG: hypothetical protein DRH24_16630 [Deltaproteobacteria bacterium]|nr:MAG: hypothetical protein DRH24_16630 [Deltaproteobacteria bacterium]
MKKSPLKSKTVWLNLVVLAVALVGAAQGVDWVAANPQVTMILGAVAGGLNLVLRFLTSQPIK